MPSRNSHSNSTAKIPAPSNAEIVSAPSADLAALPPRVAALRAKILDAVDSDDIEDLLIPLEWSETPPILSSDNQQPRGFENLIDFLKSRSFDGKGREWLAIIKAVFAAPYVRLSRGSFVSYVWPSFALVPLAPDADDAARLAVWRCVRFADLAAHDAKGRPLIQSIGIGADGTWHYLRAAPAA